MLYFNALFSIMINSLFSAISAKNKSQQQLQQQSHSSGKFSTFSEARPTIFMVARKPLASATTTNATMSFINRADISLALIELVLSINASETRCCTNYPRRFSMLFPKKVASDRNTPSMLGGLALQY